MGLRAESWIWNDAAGAIREYVEEKQNAEGEKDEIEGIDELNELADQLENDASEIEGVEFPGMYGWELAS